MATTNLEAVEVLVLKVKLSEPPMPEQKQLAMWIDVARELARRLDAVAAIGSKSRFGDPELVTGGYQP